MRRLGGFLPFLCSFSCSFSSSFPYVYLSVCRSRREKEEKEKERQLASYARSKATCYNSDPRRALFRALKQRARPFFFFAHSFWPPVKFAPVTRQQPLGIPSFLLLLFLATPDCQRCHSTAPFKPLKMEFHILCFFSPVVGRTHAPPSVPRSLAHSLFRDREPAPASILLLFSFLLWRLRGARRVENRTRKGRWVGRTSEEGELNGGCGIKWVLTFLLSRWRD